MAASTNVVDIKAWGAAVLITGSVGVVWGGPIRALVFGLRSRFFLRANPTSQRVEEVARLRVRARASRPANGFYTVVVGPKGVGKSCIVDTVIEKAPGVAFVKVLPGTNTSDIIDNVNRAITGGVSRFFDWSSLATSVLFFHRIFFWRPATVVLQAVERKADQKCADIDNAARSLAEDHGYRLRVIIDASDNSMPEIRATRGRIVEVGPASRDVLESMPNLEPLHKALKAAGLADVVWECLGGVPALYVMLNLHWRAAGGEDGGKLEAVVERFLRDRLDDAISTIRQAVESQPPLKGIYALFRTQSEVNSYVYYESRLMRSSPDKVLRKIKGNNLIPTDAATAVVLRFPDVMAEGAPGLQKLKELLCNNPPSASAQPL